MNENKTNINWYPGHMAKTKRLIRETLDLIDLVYEVVDARIPYSSKIKDIDKYIGSKPRVLIFNKTDLCDIEETNKWVDYYEKQGYNVLKLSLEKKVDLKPLLDITLKLLNKLFESRKRKGLMQRKGRVLIVGIPNVGKSTLINRLSGKKVAQVENKPGVTKGLTWIRLNDKLDLLDTPGILWPKLEEKNSFNLASFTAIKEEILPQFDVACYILKMLNKYYDDKLKERYNIDEFNEDIVVTLSEIGKKRGCIVKGGEIDYNKVIKLIINDVKGGHIRGITFDRIDE